MSWANLKPNLQKEDELWEQFVLRTSNEAQDCIKEISKLILSLDSPIADIDIHRGSILFCDEILRDVWRSDQKILVEELTKGKPKSSQLPWFYKPRSIDEIRRGIYDVNQKYSLRKILNLAQRFWEIL